MLSPRSSYHCLISVVALIISSFIDATLVDAFTVPACKATVISSAANVINHHHNRQFRTNLPLQKHDVMRRMTLDSSNSKDDELFERATTLIGKSASSLVSLSFFLLLSTQRDAITTTLFIGSILNAISGKILKKILNHDRPAELKLSDRVKLKPSDGGMPSSHAMSLSFIGTVILFGVIVPTATTTNNNNNMTSSIIAGVLMMIYSAIALRYRVRDHLHTMDQIIVGYGLGLTNAILWLKYAVFSSSNNNNAVVGPVVSMVQQYLISSSSETNQFPIVGLVVPILVGVLVVGSFERRIGVWLSKERKGVVDDDNDEDNDEDDKMK